MATTDEVKEALVENLLDGVASKKVGDRETAYRDPEKTYNVLKKIEADEVDDDGPFLRVKFGD
jgi:hypothetical protein